MLHLRTLGLLELRDADGCLLAANTKPLLVLCALTIPRGTRMSRQQIAELLWPGRSEDRAAASLRQALYTLRSLAPGVVDVRDDRLGANQQHLRVDLHEVEEALAEGDYAAAIALFAGPFLSSIRGLEGSEFDHWIQAQDDRISLGLRIAYGHVVERAISGGRAVEAAEYAAGWRAHNPLSEAAQLGFMRALKAAGDPQQALLAYQEYETLVQLEVGELPGTELRAEAQTLARLVEAAPIAAPTAVIADSLPESSGVASEPHATRRLPPPRGLAGLRWKALLLPGLLMVTATALWQVGSPRLPAAGQDGLVLPVSGSDENGATWLGDLRFGDEGPSVRRRIEGGDPLPGPGGRVAVHLEGARGIDLAVIDETGDTLAVVATRADERAMAWSPDGQFLAYWAGLAVKEGLGYSREARILEVRPGGTSRDLGTRLATSERSLAWSPDGALIAASVHQAANETWAIQLLDPSGGQVQFIPVAAGPVFDLAFSPAGSELAFSVGEGGREIHLIDLHSGAESVLASDPAGQREPQWLSGEHLAYTLAVPGGAMVAVRDLRANATYLLSLPRGVTLQRSAASVFPDPEKLRGLLRGAASLSLQGGEATWVEEVVASPNGVRVAPGELVHMEVHTSGADGSHRPPLRPISWTVTDTNIARVREPGLLEAIATGGTELIVGLPGWRTDTVAVSVTALRRRELPTLLEDDWSLGIRPSLWRPFGDPSPYAIPGAGPDGRSGAVNNNGDQNYLSGLVSRYSFAFTRGLTLEAWGRAPFTGRHFENLGFGLVADPPPEDPQAPVWPHLSVGPTVALDGQAGVVGRLDEALPLPDGTAQWHRYELQFSPSGEAWFLVDGRLMHRYRLRQPPPADATLHVVLFGAAYRTELLHGPVRVYEGQRYASDGAH